MRIYKHDTCAGKIAQKCEKTFSKKGEIGQKEVFPGNAFQCIIIYSREENANIAQKCKQKRKFTKVYTKKKSGMSRKVEQKRNFLTRYARGKSYKKLHIKKSFATR